MKLLVVEDEIKLANAIARALGLQKHVVDVVHDGSDGYDMATSEAYDAIILDVMLPRMNGVKLCTTLREEGVMTPILMLTAKGQVQDKVAALDGGADDYLVKPFSFDELFSRLRALNRRSKKIGESVLKIADLTLDPVSIQVQRGGKMITLSSKQFALLECLMRNKKSVLSKEQLVRSVWDYDANILPSTVEVHIKNLRDKVDKAFDKPLIRTVRGFGYQITDEM